MRSVEIRFAFEGKWYCGEVTSVHGAGGGSVYHLMIDKFYYGQVWKTDDTWRYGGHFDPIQENISTAVQQALNAWQQLLPEAVKEMEELEVMPEEFSEWWNDAWCVYYPVGKEDLVVFFRGLTVF